VLILSVILMREHLEHLLNHVILTGGLFTPEHQAILLVQLADVPASVPVTILSETSSESVQQRYGLRDVKCWKTRLFN